jgi:hypothetical protein
LLCVMLYYNKKWWSILVCWNERDREREKEKTIFVISTVGVDHHRAQRAYMNHRSFFSISLASVCICIYTWWLVNSLPFVFCAHRIVLSCKRKRGTDTSDGWELEIPLTLCQGGRIVLHNVFWFSAVTESNASSWPKNDLLGIFGLDLDTGGSGHPPPVLSRNTFFFSFPKTLLFLSLIKRYAVWHLHCIWFEISNR